MSTNVNLTRGTDGQLYYQDNHGHWHLYPSLNYSNPSSYVTNQQYSQDPNPPQNPTYPEGFEYDEERAEAGSFQGDPHESNGEARHASSSSRRRYDDRVAEYVEDQKRDRKHRDKPRDNTRTSRRKHKESTEKKLNDILKPFRSKG
ncbi:hypothetical protein CDEST_07826 [Colletotrichum destructivum]|uniref:Uncharacterized protein n=1 Tax=Colletotrichum destructivum TaxID=34406 RepID=A0AAX4IHA8_9PEZI|nr:hypothetical protein CDEST_07826 [Colletotrichum destructivum]